MNKQSFQSISQRCAPYVLSALLLGLSYPSYPYVRLEMLAWVWMVPMLFALKSVESFPKFLRNVYLTLLCVAVVGMSWLALSTLSGSLLLFLFFPAVVSVPLIVFYFVRRALRWRAALWSLPAVWTGWEWLYQQTEGSLGWFPIGVTQSNLTWLVQYIDITGVWGITFWLVLFNVLVVMAIEGERFSVFGFQFSEQSASLKTENSKLKTALVRRLAVVSALMLVVPLSYSAYAFIRESRIASANERNLSVMLVQPNINAWEKLRDGARPAALRKTISLTNKALAASATKPDLIILPETAVPYFLADEAKARESFYRAITRWQTPVLTGLLDASGDTQSAAGGQNDWQVGRGQPVREVFNSAALFSPGAEEAGGRLNVERSPVYHKRVLVPFVERVPYADKFPALQRLSIDMGAGNGLARGSEATVFSLQTGAGKEVKVGANICYESLYPAQTAELVKRGAQILAFITNEGWFSQTHGEYQLAAFSRLRSIETRRAVARAGNTGITQFVDSTGGVHEQAAWWSEQTLQGNVRLSDEVSLYVRYTDYFPKWCVGFALAIMAAALARILRRFARRLRWRRGEVVAVSRLEV